MSDQKKTNASETTTSETATSEDPSRSTNRRKEFHADTALRSFFAHKRGRPHRRLRRFWA